MSLDTAIQKHVDWKIKFRSAITKKETLDAATISKDNCCEFGKWLHGDGKTQYGKLDSFKTCLSKHAAFHIEAGKLASAINAGKFAEAEATLGSNSSAFSTISSEVVTSIMRLKKEI